MARNLSSLSSRREPLLSSLTDVHCHLTDTPESLTRDALERLSTGRVILMGTRPEDWDAIQTISAKYPEKVIPSFGLHPWFVDQVSVSHPNWLNLLKCRLEETPSSLLGEFGLDGIAKDRSTGLKYSMEAQLKAFEAQYDLASGLGRPVSIHMVQASGLVLDFFQRVSKIKTRKHPPTIMLHSFSGSVDIAQSLLKLPRIGKLFYFSFSTIVNARSPKMSAKIQSIPADRILLESDEHDISLVDSGMEKVLQMVSEYRGWTVEETARQVQLNTRAFLGMINDIGR